LSTVHAIARKDAYLDMSSPLGKVSSSSLFA
jgi:hypothetical protein